VNDVFNQLMIYIRGIWRYRWYIHLLAWPICIAGWYFVYSLPDEYRSSARVYVDTQSILRPLLKGLAVETNVGHQVQMITRTLLSRPNIEKVALMADMDLSAKTPGEMESLLSSLEKRIKITGVSRQNLYRLEFVDQDPQLAQQVVQSLLTIFVESALGGNRDDSNSAQKFLTKQIAEYETKLTAAEERLKEFKRANIGLMPQDGKGYFERLDEAINRLSEAKLVLKEEMNQRDELRRQQLGEEPTFGMGNNQFDQREISTSHDDRIKGLEEQLDELTLLYTDEHPDVVSTKRLLSQLEKKRESEIQEIMESRSDTAIQGDSALTQNPVYQRLRIALGEGDAKVVALKVRVEEYQKQKDELQRLVDTVPQIEAELKRLNRDYDVHKRNYETLVARKESAIISEDAERSSDELRFKIVDPPRVPLSPTGPNRLMFGTAVLFGGLVMGIVFALFLSQLKPTFDNRKTIRDVIGLPVLGGVSMVWSERQRLKNKLEAISFGLVFMGLLVVYGGYLAFQVYAPGIFD